MFNRPVKAYGTLFALTAVVTAILLMIPQLESSALTQVRIITASRCTMNTTVDCNGAVQAKNERSVYYSFPLMTNKVLAEVGQQVKAGQKLVEIDRQQTVQTLENSGLSSKSNSYSPDSNSDQSGSILQQFGDGSAAGSSGDAADIPSYIKSPISGVITALNAEQGSFTDNTQPVAVISSLNDLEVKAQVDEILISGIKNGQKASIKGDGFKTAYSGVVTKIYPSARKILTTTGTRTVVDVLLKIENPGGDLKPGLTADVSIITSESPNTVTVPYEAISQDNGNREYVFICRNGRACRTYIKTGSENDTTVTVLSGVNAGDKVIVNPPEGLKNGQAVRIGAA